MDSEKAFRICREHHRVPFLSEERNRLYVEALHFLWEETQEADFLVDLGAYYYEKKDYENAEKYYLMAAEEEPNNLYAHLNLGYIYYYGRTGPRDYKKAFYHYYRAMERGSDTAAYKLSDMYQEGLYVEKDEAMCEKLLTHAYERVKDDSSTLGPKADILLRLARLKKKKGEREEAITMLVEARFRVAMRIFKSGFFGDLRVMQNIVEELHSLVPEKRKKEDIYDLFALEAPAKINFLLEGITYPVSLEKAEAGMRVVFGETEYKDLVEFFEKAKIEGVPITQYAEDIQVER